MLSGINPDVSRYKKARTTSRGSPPFCFHFIVSLHLRINKLKGEKNLQKSAESEPTDYL